MTQFRFDWVPEPKRPDEDETHTTRVELVLQVMEQANVPGRYAATVWWQGESFITGQADFLSMDEAKRWAVDELLRRLGLAE